MDEKPAHPQIRRPASRLGFGLSSIAGLGSRADQQRLLASAYDAGVRHFDVAPYYGSGDAEAILGAYLLDGPRDVTITTKFGLASPTGQRGGRIVRQVARKVFRLLPGLKARLVSSAASATAPVRNFSAEGMVASVDQSLRNLRIERIDFLLLHDWPAERALADDAISTAAQLIDAGKVRTMGIASSAGDVQAVVAKENPIYGAFQFEHSLSSPAADLAAQARDHAVVTHRALAKTYGNLRRFLSARPGALEKWTRELGIDLSDPAVLGQALLEWALFTNAGGTVLFSSRDAGRVRQNAGVLEHPLLGAEGSARLESLFRQVASGVKVFGSLPK